MTKSLTTQGQNRIFWKGFEGGGGGGGGGGSETFSKQLIWFFLAFAKTNFLGYRCLPLPLPLLKNNGQFLTEVIKHAAWIRCDNAT